MKERIVTTGSLLETIKNMAARKDKNILRRRRSELFLKTHFLRYPAAASHWLRRALRNLWPGKPKILRRTLLWRSSSANGRGNAISPRLKTSTRSRSVWTRVLQSRIAASACFITKPAATIWPEITFGNIWTSAPMQKTGLISKVICGRSNLEGSIHEEQNSLGSPAGSYHCL